MKGIVIIDLTPKIDPESKSAVSWALVAAFNDTSAAPVGLIISVGQMRALETAVAAEGMDCIGRTVNVQLNCLDVRPCLESLLGHIATDPAFVRVS